MSTQIFVVVEIKIVLKFQSQKWTGDTDKTDLTEIYFFRNFMISRDKVFNCNNTKFEVRLTVFVQGLTKNRLIGFSDERTLKEDKISCGSTGINTYIWTYKKFKL